MSDSSEMGSSEKPVVASEVTMETSPSKTKSQEDAASQPRRELFIRSLPASATTESLAEHFSQSYVIKHAVVVLDPKTKQSKGYGFVTFADVEDAQAALEELNGSTFEGKKIKVEYAQPRQRVVDEAAGKSAPSAAALERKKEREQQKADTQPPKLIVRNLPWSINTPDDLALHFRSFGKVKYITLPKKGTQLAGFGFVVLRGKKNAEKALEAVNGKEVDGRTLAVDWAVEKEVWETQQKEDEQQEPEVKEESSDVDMDEGGVGLVDEDLDDAMNSEEDDDDDIKNEDEEDEEEEDKEGGKEDERNASTIFIRNLPFTCDDETLYDHFTEFGTLRYARIVVDPETERPRGTGFVCFWKPENAQTCVQGAPKQQDPLAAEKEKGKKGSIIKQSVLQNENADPTGKYTLDGRVLQISRAVSKSRATQLQEEGVSKRLVRDTDKRRLYLLNEGTISPSSTLYQQLSPSEIKMREDSFKQRQNFIRKNPSLHFSLTRLAVRNLPRHVTAKDLKQLAREAIVGFAKDAKEGIREPLSREEMDRASEEMREADRMRKQKGVGIVRQAKIVFEGRDGSKVDEGSGAGRSRGYGFIEYYTHRHALMGLRWLNGHAISPPKNVSEELKDRKKRMIVEFAIENAQVVKRRSELQERGRNFKKDKKDEDAPQKGDSKNNRDAGSKGQKRKRPESNNGKSKEEAEEENKVAKRNRIIAKKRMQRKSRK
ncbi:mRNA-binding ribosome biosynthesis protein NOP4 [Aspergillus puulaauensis]|uniref:RNA recognition motif-containing protein n=1 Tax=Aspergillus puulaauensis TaxID=1220207 RepID=A0A7R8ARZ7_9EURO|nr:RNA recognition motif-containing protein [Aspergillus puulaauensis]BCS28931.1 RNA recognition motif-containing protein [Aspergillus puulaauensis]